MTRGQRLVMTLTLLGLLWVFAFFVTKGGDPYLSFVVRAIPSYALICVGCYGLFEIGKGIMILKDYPEEHKLLLDDIRRARTFMNSKGL